MSEKIEKEVDRVLREALELFRTTHWTQRSYHRYDYEKRKDFYCAVGAIRTLAQKTQHPSDVRWAAVGRVAGEVKSHLVTSKEIKAYGLEDENLVVWWNDSPDRKLQDVLDVFERAADSRPPRWRRVLERALRAFQ